MYGAVLASPPVEARRAQAIAERIAPPLTAVVVVADLVDAEALADDSRAAFVAAVLARARELPVDAFWAHESRSVRRRA